MTVIQLQPLMAHDTEIGDVVELYKMIWGAESGFCARLQKHSGYHGFIGHTAKTADGEMAGFVYGYCSLPGMYYRKLMEAALTSDEIAYWLDDCYEFVELGVRPKHQGNGIGTMLHDRLLQEATCKTAILSTQYSNVRARCLYERLGWVCISESFFPASPGPRYILMGNRLREG
ncbi:GNAT family N-acetyltransferase [Peribacillus sp. SCS-155]|uniref:GNAT family N-acetyltransferase n=1 Tax=Peribacillus sedimenti TaxID=3115297 RepID=UPI00390576BA